jgi:hypothetical protein
MRPVKPPPPLPGRGYAGLGCESSRGRGCDRPAGNCVSTAGEGCGDGLFGAAPAKEEEEEEEAVAAAPAAGLGGGSALWSTHGAADAEAAGACAIPSASSGTRRRQSHNRMKDEWLLTSPMACKRHHFSNLKSKPLPLYGCSSRFRHHHSKVGEADLDRARSACTDASTGCVFRYAPALTP